VKKQEVEEPELHIPGPFADWLRGIAAGEKEIPNAEGERHHYTPKFVLMRFRGPDRRLFQLGKTDGSCEPVKPKDAAWESHLYAVESIDGQHDGIIEGLFSVAENFAAPSLVRLLSEQATFTDADRGNIAFLLAIQEQRAPGWIEEFKQRLIQVGMMYAAVELANRRGSETTMRRARKAADAIVSGRVTMEPSRELVLGMTLMGLSATIAPAYGLPWTLFRAREAAFVTSDRPLTMHDPTPPHKFSGAAWLSSEFATVTMPLSSRACLQTCPNYRHHFSERYTTTRIDRINLQTYGWATRYVYGPSQEILESLHARALAEPEAVPAPTKKRHVILEDLSTADPAVAERNAAKGWDRHVAVRQEDGTQRLFSYEVIDTDEDARRAVAPRRRNDDGDDEWASALEQREPRPPS
jgi:Protein of unknown function (DUF4238)